LSYLYFKDGKPISHRSWIKIIFNPLLRLFFGRAIGSEIENNRFVGYKLIKQTKPISWNLKPNFDYDYKIKC
jgi:hypothetical protein